MKIFIGSSCNNNISKKYLDDCEKLISKLLKKNDLVFGACSDGLMGTCYNEALKNNRNIIGISPEVYKTNFDKLKCNEKIITNSVIERTNKLIEMSDVLLFLPGGIGTLTELFTCIEGKRGKEFNKKIIIYNSCNYYDNLIEFLDNAIKNNFINNEVKELYYISNNIEDIINYLD